MSFDLNKPLEEWTSEELEALAAHKREEEKSRQIEETKVAIKAIRDNLQLLEEKQRLHLAELARLQKQLAGLEGREPRISRRRRRPKKMVGTHIRLPQIMESGLTAVPLPIRATWKGKTYEALVTEDGQVQCDGEELQSLSGAAAYLVPGITCSGWKFWRYQDAKGEWHPLYHLRDSVYRHQSARDENH